MSGKKAAAKQPPKPAAGAAKPTARGPKRPASSPNRRPLIVVAGIVLVAVALAAWAWLGGGGTSPGGSGQPPGGTGSGAIGSGGACQGTPHFVAQLQVGPRAALGTSVTGIKGLAVIDPDKPRENGGVFQHESWDDAGYLGPYAYDADGNIYVAPAPLDNVKDNPPELQNRIYKVDTDTMEMRLLAELPSAQPPSGANPFGVIGLAYDCDTRGLYAASVAGSTAGQEVGRILRVDPASGQSTVIQEGLDPFGLATFNGATGKRLYYGLARQPELWSVALDAAGLATGEPRRELSLAELADGTQDKIRRVRFPAAGGMTLNAYDFTYTLQVASEREERVFNFAYDGATDGWGRVGE